MASFLDARLPAPMAAFKNLPKRTLPLLLDAGHFDPFEHVFSKGKDPSGANHESDRINNLRMKKAKLRWRL